MVAQPVDVRGQPVGVGQLHPLRALQEDEVLQRRLAEREQAQLHAGWITLRLMGEVWPAHIRRGPDGDEQVLHHGPVQHLLCRHIQHHPAPPLHGDELVSLKSRTAVALQTERSIEVLAHQGVLELAGQAQQVGQLLAPFHHDG